QVNDEYGHDVGDKVLKEVANIIKNTIREADLAIRYGGEEFMVLLMDVNPEKAAEIAEKIRKRVENKVIAIGSITLRKTVSIGVSVFPVDSEHFWQCIKFADVALYKAKEEGRNKVVRFEKDMWQSEEY
ncbi:GGDEF domain-containing protein, partial [Hydrogenivirga sp. 128-5-R1-1]|uniref:GGDEF domain-containing protein n=1 Tax=Hydrogenivirga sp. 128-5-R1-1 TaxID=392423 RepID=UPI00015F0428